MLDALVPATLVSAPFKPLLMMISPSAGIQYRSGLGGTLDGNLLACWFPEAKPLSFSSGSQYQDFVILQNFQILDALIRQQSSGAINEALPAPIGLEGWNYTYFIKHALAETQYVTSSASIDTYSLNYTHILDRMRRFKGVSKERVENAWNALTSWGSALWQDYYVRLQNPAVFADDEFIIEFEWEIGDRSLIIRLVDADMVEYITLDSDDDNERRGFTSNVDNILSKLAWVHGF